MKRKIYILNGPNLNMLGVREPDIYGSETLKDIENACLDYIRQKTNEKPYCLEFMQSNYEGVLIETIHKAQKDAVALLINPAAYGHTSLALYDALKMLKGIPVIEVHLSIPTAREAFRQKSYISQLADGVISGFGLKSYIFGIDAALWLIERPEKVT